MNPLNIIKALRDSFPQSNIVFTRGSCGQLFNILSQIFPDAEAYSNGEHIITKINDTYYDINGLVQDLDDYALCNSDDKLLTNVYMGDLMYVQCPNCDEVYHYLIEDDN